MTTPLRDRPLQPGRGRTYCATDSPTRFWYVDYRAPNGMLYGAYADTPAEAADWIRSKAKEAQK